MNMICESYRNIQQQTTARSVAQLLQSLQPLQHFVFGSARLNQEQKRSEATLFLIHTDKASGFCFGVSYAVH